ncbi:MAG: hypothetical protein DRG25_00490 [Deltaproteobacteria bacterium]|nr:MAG: hypothetical protein DRG25_00490 [Deltaproteobacteria bacterium]
MNQKGFTLIEVMIAIVILSVGLLALAQMQIFAMNGNLFASNMTVASTLAQDKLEELKGVILDDPDLMDTNPANNGSIFDPRIASFYPPDHEDPNNPINESGGTTGLRRYTRLWNIADDTPTEGAKTVVVFVFWGSPNPANNNLPQHYVSVSTIVGGE